jgi:hypothetical protein
LHSFVYRFDDENWLRLEDVLSSIRTSSAAAAALEILEFEDDSWTTRQDTGHSPSLQGFTVETLEQLSSLLGDFPRLRRLCIEMTISCELIPAALDMIRRFEGRFTIRMKGGEDVATLASYGLVGGSDGDDVSDDDFRKACEALQNHASSKAYVTKLVVYPGSWWRPVYLHAHRVKQVVSVAEANSCMTVVDLSQYCFDDDGERALVTALDTGFFKTRLLTDRRGFCKTVREALERYERSGAVLFFDEEDQDPELDNPHSDMFMGYSSD